MSATPFVHNLQAGPVGLKVGKAWHDANAANYVSMTDIPIVTVPGQKALTKGSGTYTIEKLGSIIHRTHNDPSYQIGDDPPAPAGREKEDITYATDGKHGIPDPWPLETPSDGQHAREYWESYAEIDGQMRSRAYSRREAALVAHLVSATYGQETFTGTEPIGDRDVTGDQQVWRDIKTQLRPIFKWARPGLSKVGFIDQALLDALTTNMDLVGGLIGSAVPNVVTEETVLTLLRAHLGLDKIKRVQALVNTAGVGATDAVDYVSTTGMLWLGLLDSRMKFDFRGGATVGPDGAFACAQASSPWVKTWEPPGRETKLYADRDEFGYYSIRGGDFGVCFTQNITT